MPVELVIAPGAGLESPKPTSAFLGSGDACSKSIRRRPEMYPVVSGAYRRSPIRCIPLATRTNGANALLMRCV